MVVRDRPSPVIEQALARARLLRVARVDHADQHIGLLRFEQLPGLRDGGGLRNKRRRKIAIVAVARRLAVDIWKWQTGQVTPEKLGWKMAKAAA